MRIGRPIVPGGMLSRPIRKGRSASARQGAATAWQPTFLVIVAVLILAGIALGYFLGAQGTFQPGVDVSGRTAAAVPLHIKALQSDDAAIRKKAATSLWLIGREANEATPALLVALQDPDGGVREAVVRALGHCGNLRVPAVLAGLVAALGDRQAEVRAAAAAAFADLWADETNDHSVNPADKTVAIGPLTEALNDPEPRVRQQAAKALTEAGPLAESAAERLANLARGDADRDVRLQAVLALGNIGPGARVAVPALLDVLCRDSRDGIRGNAGWALGKIHAQAETVIPALVDAFLREEMNDTRGMIAMGLAGYGNDTRSALPLLEAAATEPRVRANQALLQSIQRIIKEIEARVPAPKGSS